MKYGIISDLHLEFRKQNPWDFIPDPDVFYLCAGDIDSNMMRRHDFIGRHLDHMFYVLGNHDFYGRSFPERGIGLSTYQHGDHKIVGATLWTDLSNPKDWFNYVNGLVDSRYIDGLTYEKYNERFAEHLEFICESGADVVVTHHCPTLLAIAPQFQFGESTKYNPGFSSDLENTIRNLAKPPKLWVYGHTHWRHSYKIGETLFVCNPLGYPGENKEQYAPVIVEIE